SASGALFLAQSMREKWASKSPQALLLLRKQARPSLLPLVSSRLGRIADTKSIAAERNLVITRTARRPRCRAIQANVFIVGKVIAAAAMFTPAVHQQRAIRAEAKRLSAPM